MVSSILLWRTNNNDLERRMGDIRLGKKKTASGPDTWAERTKWTNRIPTSNKPMT